MEGGAIVEYWAWPTRVKMNQWTKRPSDTEGQRDQVIQKDQETKAEPQWWAAEVEPVLVRTEAEVEEKRNNKARRVEEKGAAEDPEVYGRGRASTDQN